MAGRSSGACGRWVGLPKDVERPRPGGSLRLPSPQAAEPSGFEDDFGDDLVDVLVVPTLEDDFDDDFDGDPDVEEESADEPPEPFDCAVLLAESLPPPERLPPLEPLPELLPLRESFRESLE